MTFAKVLATQRNMNQPRSLPAGDRTSTLKNDVTRRRIAALLWPPIVGQATHPHRRANEGATDSTPWIANVVKVVGAENVAAKAPPSGVYLVGHLFGTQADFH